MKRNANIALCIICVCLSNAGICETNQIWVGKLFDITPKSTKVSKAHCEAHVPDRYETTLPNVNKSAKGDNGITITDIKSTVEEKGGIYLTHGKSEFKGSYHGKSFTESVEYYAQTLEKIGPTQGIWFTKDCKGFYSITPK